MPAVKGEGMRGLAVFISDIRNCKSKEAEIKRINKELANIRSKFKGDKTLDGYQKKKYVCKLLFIFLLGHDIDFGHMEAVNLLSSNKYSEKQIGYLFISVLMNANNDLMKLIIQSIKNDLSSRNPIHVNLALQCIANIGSREMAETFGSEIPKLLVSGDTIDVVKQSAALCLLRLFRTLQDIIPSGEWTSRIIHLLNDQHMGVVTAAVSLINALVKKNPDEYKGCVSLAVSRLSRIVTASYTDLQDYTYYFVPAPWLSVKLLRLLQNYPPPEDPGVRGRLTECIETILNKAQEPPKSKKVQHSNAKNAVLFEAISLIIHMDSEPNLLVRACNQLGQFLQHRETNLRYLALESMCLLATSEFSHEAVKKHQETVVNSLKTERDVSVRQRAVDLLYAMCDKSNAEEIVGEMLHYLETADYSIREEMVLKVAILAEKYASDYTWYVDVILNLIRIAGDYVSEEVWYRVIQIVINREDVQGYAAKTVFEALQAPACHENMVKVAGYILGEFGNLIAGDQRSSPIVQFQLLHSKYHLCAASTRALLLTTYVKFINLFAEIKTDIQNILKSDTNIRSADAELQQRSVEYLHLSNVASADVLATVLEEMPPYPERESSILAVLKKKKPGMAEGINAVILAGKDFKSVSNGAAAYAAAENAVNASSTVDLLGISSSTTTVATTNGTSNTTNSTGLLVDVFGDLTSGDGQGSTVTAPVSVNNTSNGPHAPSGLSGSANASGAATPITAGGIVISNEDSLKKFVCKQNGVIFVWSFNDFGHIKRFNEKKKLHFWEGACNDINGTDGTQFPPGTKSEDTLYVFSSDVCRSLKLRYEEDLSIEGISAMRFVVPNEVFADPNVNADNMCFCSDKEKDGTCPIKASLIPLRTCQDGVPIMASAPHFYQGDSEYYTAFENLVPNKEKHQTYIDVEPLTGTVISAAKRIQINFKVEPNKKLKFLSHVDKVMYFPALWVQEGGLIDEKTASDFRERVLKPYRASKWSLVAVIIVGAVALLVVGVLLLLKGRQKKKH